MPYTPEQMRAIAARMRAEGKSREEIRRFFHKHTASVSRDHPMMKRVSKKR